MALHPILDKCLNRNLARIGAQPRGQVGPVSAHVHLMVMGQCVAHGFVECGQLRAGG